MNESMNAHPTVNLLLIQFVCGRILTDSINMNLEATMMTESI